MTPPEVNLTGEAVAFSFSTSNTPAILLFVSSKTQDYLALVLRQNGETLTHTDTLIDTYAQTRGLCLSGMLQMQYVRSLVVCVRVCVRACVRACVCVFVCVGTLQVRYNLGGLKEPFTIDVDQRNLANGQPHTINMSRTNRTITIQLDHYPPVSYSLPEASNTQFNLVKTLFLGKVFGEYRHRKRVFDRGLLDTGRERRPIYSESSNRSCTYVL
uniref:Laminin G domain-containing protein n=1 Tax=Hucho hucho TaxID=62062 RepID=A0A4W5JE30_9TELE